MIGTECFIGDVGIAMFDKGFIAFLVICTVFISVVFVWAGMSAHWCGKGETYKIVSYEYIVEETVIQTKPVWGCK